MRMLLKTINRIHITSTILSVICLSNLLLIGVASSQQSLLQQSSPIRIVQEQMQLFGGVNSIRASIGNSHIGILYGTSINRQPLHIFTIFSQKIAEVEIKNRVGTVTNRTELIVQNTFLITLDSIYEFEDQDNDNFFNSSTERNYYRRVDLSNVYFQIRRLGEHSNTSESEVHYQVSFSGSNIPYKHLMGNRSTAKLENLDFVFDFELTKNTVRMPKIPTITIQPRVGGLDISTDFHRWNVQAIQLSPRLKFSCNISGWDYSSSDSKLLFKVNVLSHEQILSTFKPIARNAVTREILKSTNFLGRLKFKTEQAGKVNQFNLDHDDNQTINYTNQRFAQLSLGSSLRDFLNFTWKPTLLVDGTEHSVIFQPLSSEERQLPLRPSTPSVTVPTLHVIGGFIFPQGSEILYDPEIQIEELNPQFRIFSVPNRFILQDSSLIILISGFFVGIVLLFRRRSQRYYR